MAHLVISAEAWQEIATKLKEAGYDHAIIDGRVIDMQGISLVEDALAMTEVVGTMTR